MKQIDDEIWKDIVGYEGLYQISNYARIKRLSRKVKSGFGSYRTINEMILTPKSDNGYKRIGLTKDNVRKMHSIHRLVYEAFVGKINDGYELDHIDTDRTNNSLSNLRIVTSQENKNNPLTLKHYSTANKKKAKRRGVIVMDLDGNIMYYFSSMSDAARELGLHVSGIGHCCKGDFKDYKGYKFEYN